MKTAIAMQSSRSQHRSSAIMQTFRRQRCRLVSLICLSFVLPFAARAQTTAPTPPSPAAQALVDKGVLAAIRYMIDSPYFCPIFLGHPKARAAASKASGCFMGGNPMVV
jgi:hypothetical protein